MREEQRPNSSQSPLCLPYPQEWLNQPQNALITGPLITLEPSPSCLWHGGPLCGSLESSCKSPVFPHLTAPSPSGGVRGHCLPPLARGGVASPPRNASGPLPIPGSLSSLKSCVWLCHLLPSAVLCHTQAQTPWPTAGSPGGLGLKAGLGLEGCKDCLESFRALLEACS